MPWRLRPSIRWARSGRIFTMGTAGKAAPIITLADALQSLRTVEAVRRLIATGDRRCAGVVLKTGRNPACP